MAAHAGVTVLSAIPIFALILAANAIGLYSDLFFFGIPLNDKGVVTPETLAELNSVQIGNFLRAIQGVIVAVFVFLIVRFVIHYYARIVQAWENATTEE